VAFGFLPFSSRLLMWTCQDLAADVAFSTTRSPWPEYS
jgi:hypothetical protein